MSTRNRYQMPGHALGWLPTSTAGTSVWLSLEGYDVVDRAAAYGSGAFSRWPAFDSVLYASLLPASLAKWAPSFATYGPPGYDCGTVTPAPKLCLEALDFPANRTEWLRRANAVAASSTSSSVLLETLRYPHQVLRLGYGIAVEAARRDGIEAPEFSFGLGLVAIGNFGLLSRATCDACFRVAVPGLRRCALHTQSKFIDVDSTTKHPIKSVAARTARRVMKHLEWPTNRPPELDWGNTEEWIAAAILWPQSVRLLPSVSSEIDASLRESPEVMALLQEDILDCSQQGKLKALRSSIDLHEWYPGAWPTKIRLAEAWIKAERVVAPGRPPRGLREVNRERLKIAVSLLGEGKSKGEVASLLGIERSHLSHLLGRARAARRSD